MRWDKHFIPNNGKMMRWDKNLIPDVGQRMKWDKPLISNDGQMMRCDKHFIPNNGKMMKWDKPLISNDGKSKKWDKMLILKCADENPAGKILPPHSDKTVRRSRNLSRYCEEKRLHNLAELNKKSWRHRVLRGRIIADRCRFLFGKISRNLQQDIPVLREVRIRAGRPGNSLPSIMQPEK